MANPIDDDALTIYTDGSAYQSPRRGGVGILFVAVDDDGHEVALDYPLPGYTGATNNQAELRACIDALSAVGTGRAPFGSQHFKRIEIRTDSRYVAENIHNARFVWPTRDWTTRDGNPVLNAPLWKELLRASGRAPGPSRQLASIASGPSFEPWFLAEPTASGRARTFPFSHSPGPRAAQLAPAAARAPPSVGRLV